MPVKLRLQNGTVVIFDDGNVTCAAESPDPDMYRAELVAAPDKLNGELFDYEPFNMDRSNPNVVY